MTTRRPVLALLPLALCAACAVAMTHPARLGAWLASRLPQWTAGDWAQTVREVGAVGVLVAGIAALVDLGEGRR